MFDTSFRNRAGPRQTAAAAASGDNFDAELKRFTQAIIGADQEGAEQVMDELLSTQPSLGEIYLRVISPALVSVGESWCRGDIGVDAEHLATQIVTSQMERVRAVFTRRESRSPYRVVVCCVEGEQHFIGARMVADLCLSRGWNVDFLGPDVPHGALIDMIQRRQPQVLALSMTMTEGFAKARALIEAIQPIAPLLGIVVGGQGVPDAARVKNVGLRCDISRDAVDGVAVIGKLLRADRPTAVLKEYQLVLARRVRELRTRNGWTQEQLAEATRVTRVCIVAVEGGKQNVSMDILIRLANALSVAPETLLSVAE